MWRSRLRWRFRGAWQWPTFAVATVVDAVVLARMPYDGDRGHLLGTLLGAGLLNLVVVAVVPRPLGLLVRWRQPSLPREVAADRAGTAGLLALIVALIVGGIAHLPELGHGDLIRAVRAASDYAARHAPRQYLVNIHRPRTWHPGGDLYRVCFPGPDPRRDWCVYVHTAGGALVRHDPDQRPNATIAGPDNPGRSDG